MKYISTFYIWFVGGISYLTIFILIILISPFLSTKKLHSFLEFTSKITILLMLFRIKKNFEVPIDKTQPYIIMPNHVSIFDVLLSATFLPIYSNGIEANSHFKIFLYGRVIRILKQIPIDRKSVRKSIKTFEIAKERIKNGVSILVYPEGTRSKTGKLQTFKKIPFKFAKEAKVSILPIGYVGVEKVSPQKSFWIKPTKITINFGKPITKEEIEKMTVDELSERTRKDISRLITPETSIKRL